MPLYPFEQMKSVPSGLDYSLKDFLRQNKSNTELLMQIAESMGVSVEALQDTIAEHEANLETTRRENWIINGPFILWQRGVSAVSPGDGVYLADRFSHHHLNDGAVTISRSTDVPGSSLLPGVQYSFYVDVTTADASIGATQYEAIRYRVEGYDAYQLYGRTCTLSFWVKSNKTGVYSVGFRNGGLDRSYVDEYTIYQPGVWEQKIITLPINFSGGTNYWTNSYGLVIIWDLACGSTYLTSSLKTWLTGNYFSSSNQVNFMNSTDNYFQITGVQLNIGSTAPPFIARPIQHEIALAERYYEKSYDLDVTPGTVTTTGAVYQPYVSFPNVTAGYNIGSLYIPFRVKKRTSSVSVLVYSPNTGVTSNFYDHTAATDVSCSASYSGSNGCMYYAVSPASSTYIAFSCQWSCNAEG